jgi:hypothetical protein
MLSHQKIRNAHRNPRKALANLNHFWMGEGKNLDHLVGRVSIIGLDLMGRGPQHVG